MKVYRFRYLFTWFRELKDRYQEAIWVTSDTDLEKVKREFLATICMNGDLVVEDVKILDVHILGDLIEKGDRLGVKYDFG